LLMLSDVVFYDALIDSVFYFFLPFILGLFFMIQGGRAKTKLLFYYGLALIGVSMSLGGYIFFDLATILITGNNIDGQLKLYLMWVPTAALAGPLMAYVWSEIIIPKKKWYFLFIVLILNMLILLDLFIFHWMTPIIIPPTIPGEGLVEVHYGLLIPTQRLPARWSLFVNSYGLVFGAGVLYKASEMKGIFRKKYIYLSISILLHCLSRILMFQMIQAFSPIPSK